MIKRKNIGEFRTDDIKNMEHLFLTRNIINENEFTHDVWKWLDEQYKSINLSDSISRATCSILNSILNQERIYFAVTRTGVNTLLKEDRNFKINRGVGFRNGSYSKILSFLQEHGFIQKLIDSNGFSATGYEVIDPLLLSYLERTIDRESQKQQVVEFVSNYKTGTALGTNVGTEDNKILRKEDNKTTRQQDNNITRQQENKTTRQQDNKIIRQEDSKTTESLSLSVPPSATDVPPSAKRNEYVQILNLALSVDKKFLSKKDVEFLEGKEAYLNTKGTFTDKQVQWLQNIIAKSTDSKNSPKNDSQILPIRSNEGKLTNFERKTTAPSQGKGLSKETLISIIKSNISLNEKIKQIESYSIPDLNSFSKDGKKYGQRFADLILLFHTDISTLNDFLTHFDLHKYFDNQMKSRLDFKLSKSSMVS